MHSKSTALRCSKDTPRADGSVLNVKRRYNSKAVGFPTAFVLSFYAKYIVIFITENYFTVIEVLL